MKLLFVRILAGLLTDTHLRKWLVVIRDERCGAEDRSNEIARAMRWLDGGGMVAKMAGAIGEEEERWLKEMLKRLNGIKRLNEIN